MVVLASRFLVAILLVVIVALGGCSENPSQLKMVTPLSPVDRAIAAEVADLLHEHSAVTVDLLPGSLTDEEALDALASGAADVAMISNNMPYRPGIATVIPLYPTVLHIAHRADRVASNGKELLDGATVFAGSSGSASRLMFQRIINRLNLPNGTFTYAEDLTVGPDVLVVFAPIAPDRGAEYPGMRLFSLGEPDDIGRGSIVDAARLIDPQLRPFVIPVSTYGDATPEPVVTVAVDMLLVARADLGAPVVYDLVTELLRLRPALAAIRPGLFEDLGDQIDAGNSTFVLHPGLVSYMQRNAPSVYERYSGIAEVTVTIIAALISGTIAATRILRRRRKNRIDEFYKQVIAIRTDAMRPDASDDRDTAREEIRRLQNQAFELLVNEKLAADESFRIFITLANDVLAELDQHVQKT